MKRQMKINSSKIFVNKKQRKYLNFQIVDKYYVHHFPAVKNIYTLINYKE